MITTIQSIAIFPGSATELFVNDAWSMQLGGAPSFFYQFKDSSGAVLNQGNTTMTEDQWNGWAVSEDDEEYILTCVAENLGVTIVE